MAVRSLPLLYMTDLSPPVRSVLLTARALGLTLNRKELNLGAKENHQNYFIEKNPQGTVPLLEDDDCVICDSHAISGYLVNKYGKDDALYPREPGKRAMVDQRLHFESGIVYPVFRNIVYPMIFADQLSLNREGLERVYNVYKTLNSILESTGGQWLAGEKMTIADLSNISTVSTLEVFTPSTGKFRNLDMWLNRCKSEIPGYREANQRGLDRLVKLIKAKLSS